MPDMRCFQQVGIPDICQFGGSIEVAVSDHKCTGLLANLLPVTVSYPLLKFSCGSWGATSDRRIHLRSRAGVGPAGAGDGSLEGMTARADTLMATHAGGAAMA